MNSGISFQAILQSVRTTSDGGWRITLDVAANDSVQVLQLSQFRNDLLSVGVIPVGALGDPLPQPEDAEDDLPLDLGDDFEVEDGSQTD
jgi:hypothetical protein